MDELSYLNRPAPGESMAGRDHGQKPIGEQHAPAEPGITRAGQRQVQLTGFEAVFEVRPTVLDEL